MHYKVNEARAALPWLLYFLLNRINCIIKKKIKVRTNLSAPSSAFVDASGASSITTYAYGFIYCWCYFHCW